MDELDERTKKEARDALFEAIEDGEDGVVNKILEKFPSILSLQSDIHFTCFLHLACMHDQGKIFEILLQKGADVNKVDDFGDTPLHIALCHEADKEIIQTLINSGADVFKQNVKGLSPFLLACTLGSYETLNELSRCGQLPEHHKDVYNQSGIHILLKNWPEFEKNDSLAASIKLLLKLGIGINDRDYYGQTALHIAFQQRAFTFIPQLIDYGADPFLYDNYGETFMTSTTFADQLFTEECSQLLRSVIHKIYETEHSSNGKNSGNQLVKQFLNVQNLTGKSVLHLFLRVMDTSTLQFLINNGADVNLQDNIGQTSLHVSAKFVNEHAKLDLLIKNGASTDVRDICQRTALYEASDAHTAEILLARGSDPNVSDKIGISPLHVAVLDFRIDVIQVLLNFGASINCLDRHGSSALHFAAWLDFTEVFAVFEEHGADSSITDFNGYTAEDIRQELAKSDRPKSHTADCIETPIERSDENERTEKEKKLFPGNKTVEDFAADLLSTPRLGLLKNVGETAYVRNIVFDLLDKISTFVCSLDKDFQGRLFPTGSSTEGTRVGQPDEFDCLYFLDKVSESCDIFENGLYLFEGFVELKAKPSINVNPKLFDNDGFLNGEVLRDKFADLVKIAIQQKNLWSTNELFEIILVNDCLKPVINLEVRYIGSYFKTLEISIDIVPAVYIKGWWPSYITTPSLKLMHENVKDAGCAILLQNPVIEIGEEEVEHFMRISSAPAEIALFQLLPAYVKHSYALAKILVGGKVCPSIKEESGISGEAQSIPAGEYISSYMLKNCLLYEVEQINEGMLSCPSSMSDSNQSSRFVDGESEGTIIYSRQALSQEISQDESIRTMKGEAKNNRCSTCVGNENIGTSVYEGSFLKISETVGLTRKIILRLRQSVESGKLSAYFLPELNIFGLEYRAIYNEDVDKVEESINANREQRLHIISMLLQFLNTE